MLNRVKTNQKNETLFGNKTVLSNMSDWNPAEMIGRKPSQLASSLYSELITNSIWSQQRSDYGYKDVYPNKLMLQSQQDRDSQPQETNQRY